MKRTQARVSVLLPRIFAVALLVGLAPAVHAGDKPCSAATLNGSFGFYRAGSTSTGPLAAVGIITFDGNGNGFGTQSISRNGVFTFDSQGASLYEVAPDCTGRQLTPAGVEVSRIVVVDGGNAFYALSETAGNAVYVFATRIGKN